MAVKGEDASPTYVQMTMHMYEKIRNILQSQEQKINELTLAEDDKIASLRAENSSMKQIVQKLNQNLKTLHLGKKGLQQELYTKSMQLGICQKQLKAAQKDLEKCQNFIIKLNGMLPSEFEEGENSEDSNSADSVDYEDEESGLPEVDAEVLTYKSLAGVPHTIFKAAITENEELKSQILEHVSRIKQLESDLKTLSDEKISPEKKKFDNSKSAAFMDVLKVKYEELKVQNAQLKEQLKKLKQIKEDNQELRDRYMKLSIAYEDAKANWEALKFDRDELLKKLSSTQEMLIKEQERNRVARCPQGLLMATGRTKPVQTMAVAHNKQLQQGVVQDGPTSLSESLEEDSGVSDVCDSGQPEETHKLGPLDCPRCFMTCQDQAHFESHYKKCCM